ncbi:DUF1648 domain-containing protein [Lacticaseibacillus sharpeae]|nr:DUF1648 domain-containing protein [Lacticaseibacillus sharpeae]
MTLKERMKYLFWSLVVIVMPLFYGLANYDRLPAKMAIHWGLHNKPNGFVDKPIAVFGLIILMVALQIIMMAVTWLNSLQKGAAKKFEKVTLGVIPVLTFVLYIATIMVNLGTNVNIWAVAMTLVGLIFIVLGNYMPKIPADYNRGPGKKKWRDHPEAWKKMSRELGFVMVGGGILCIISILLAEWVSIVALILTVAGISYVGFRGQRYINEAE